MSKLEIEYKGYNIEFSEYKDCWSCPTLEIRDKPTLGAVKKEIDKWDLANRRVPSVGLIAFGWNGIKSVTAMTISDDGRVWCRNGQAREKISLAELLFDTPEIRKSLDEINELSRQANALREKINERKDALPRVTLDELRDKAAGQIDEDDAA